VVARLSSEALKDSFWFPKRLGQRLAELRKQQGLTQQQVAVLMGRQGQGNWTLVSAVELGRMKTPSLRLVADYLRACRSSFDDLRDILDAYTGQRTVADEAGATAVGAVTSGLPVRAATEVRKYDAKKAAARRASGKLPDGAGERQVRAQKLARHALLREKLHQRVKKLINIEHLDRNWQDRKLLLEHARRLYGALNRSRGRPAEERASMLDKARAWLAEQNLVPAAALDRVQQAVVEWYEKLEQTGGLDKLPSATARPGREPGKKSLARREREQALEPLNAYLAARNAAIEQLWQEAQELLASEQVAPARHKHFRGLLLHICHAVDHHAPDSDQCRRLIDDYLAGPLFKAPADELSAARAIAARLVEAYSTLRQSLPGDPRGWTRPPS